jgi:hypothetical protein
MAMTKSEKAHDTRVFRAAREISASITALTLPVSDDQVLAVMKESKCSGRVLCDAFWLMDNEPSRFADHQVWHPRLRSLRNHPDGGRQMFALFK